MYYTVDQVADILHIAPATVYKLAKLKGLPIANLGKRMTRIPEQALEDWIQEQIDEEGKTREDHLKQDK